MRSPIFSFCCCKEEDWEFSFFPRSWMGSIDPEGL